MAFVKADVNRRWAALYGQLLAAASGAHEGAEAPAPSPAPATRRSTFDIRFPSLNLPAAGDSLPDPADVRTYEQARALFLKASKHLEAAKTYFALDGFASDHAHLQRETSWLYRHLSSFETVRSLDFLHQDRLVS